jgi:hypothetical protein
VHNYDLSAGQATLDRIKRFHYQSWMHMS